MHWWGDRNLAQQFAEAVGNHLCSVNNTWGPWFGYTRNPLGGSFRTAYWYYDFNTSTVTDRSDGGDDSGTSANWAQATQVPAPLPILGAGAAFTSVRRLQGMSRRLQHRPQA